jgi:type IV secretory pathway VirB4 component
MALNAKTTQEFVPIKEIRQGIVLLKDNSMRAIVMASSLNFALKSAEEQQSIVFQFQNFLNSLDFSTQIFIQSRRLDIRPYIALLENRLREQTGDLIKIQTREYMEFIRNFTENSNIMTKSFFIVVPYNPSVVGKGDIAGIFGKKKTASENAENKLAQFEEHRSQLEQRISVVTQGLARCGIRTVELGTEEIVELFYKMFNPGDTEKPIPLT